MKIYSFTSPDGETYEIQGPEGQEEQAFNLLQQAIAAGQAKPVKTTKPKELSPLEKAGIGIKQAFLGAGDVVDTTTSLALSSLARPVFGKEAQEEIFSGLQDRKTRRKQMMGTEDPGVLGKVVGAVGTLPMQIAAMPFGPTNTSAEFLEQGESMPRALAAGGIDAVGTVVGLGLPAAAAGGPVKRMATGALINAAQDTLTRLGIAGVAEQDTTKQIFSPTVESALVSGIVGGGVGAVLGKPAPKKPMPVRRQFVEETKPITERVLKEDPIDVFDNITKTLGGQPYVKPTPFDAMVETLQGQPRVVNPEMREAPIDPTLRTGEGGVAKSGKLARRKPEGSSGLWGVDAPPARPLEAPLGRELPGKVNLELLAQRRAEEAALRQQEYEDALEAQRVREAEQFVADNTPEQSTVGLSLGQNTPGGRVVNRQSVGDSGLMGLPARPVEPPVGLSTGENAVGGAIINRKPVGDSGVMPQAPEPIGLSTGEGKPGGQNINRKPEGSSGVMGVEPKQTPELDPFGGVAGPGRVGGRRNQRGGIDPDLLTFGLSRLIGNKRKGEKQTKTNIFGGAQAFSAPLSSLRLAKEAAANGVAADDIWNNYGWVQAGDGKWRFELDDSNLYVKPEGLAKLKDKHTEGGKTVKLEDLIDHPSLFENYPQLRKLRVEVSKKDVGDATAHFDSSSNAIRFSVSKSDLADLRTKKWTDKEAREYMSRPDVIEQWTRGETPENKQRIIQAMMDDPQAYIEEIAGTPENNQRRVDRDFTNTLIHEIQHAVQAIEGFQPGYNWREVDGTVKYSDWEKTHGEIEAEESNQRLRYSAEDRRWDLPLQNTLDDNVLLGQDYPVVKAKFNNRFGQGGSTPMFTDLAQGIVNLGAGLKAKFTGQKAPQEDTVVTPRSPETIAQKQEKARKARAIGATDSVYYNPTTVEEVLANPGKDIGKYQAFGAGSEGVVRRNPTNNVVKFLRSGSAKARTATDFLTKKFVTGPDGINRAVAKLSEQEKMEIHLLIQKMSKDQFDYSSAVADQYGLTPAQRNFMDKRQQAFQAQLELANKINGELGFELIKPRAGYSPGMFSGTYQALIGKTVTNKDGTKQFIVEGHVGSNSKWEFEQGQQYYKDKGLEVVKLDRRGLNTQVKSRRYFDDTTKLLAILAEKDPRFAEAKADLDAYITNQTKNLYGFNVHELQKKGIEGNIGNKPWLDAKRNAKEFFEAEVGYLDEAFGYWNLQKFLGDARKLAVDPKLADMPNTKKFVDDYTKHITGNNLNPIGSAANWVVDGAFAVVGGTAAKAKVSLPENPNAALSGAMEFSSAIMMNIWNTGFAAIQLVQMFEAGIPEALKIANEGNLPASNAMTSLGGAVKWRSILEMQALMEQRGVPVDKSKVPAQWREAFDWMKAHALDHYNEVQMSHEAAVNPKWQKAKDIAFWPSRLPEMFTRPTVFMWYADLFREAGLSGDNLYQTARNATDWAMANYRPEERPMVYQQLGVTGRAMGGLKTFVHNKADQMISRTKEAKQNPAAFAAMVGFAGALMGISGLPFYNEIDEIIVQPATGETARHWLEKAIAPEFIDGFASAYSGLDWQSRFSMGDLAPNSMGEAIAGPQLSKLYEMGASAVSYIRRGDEQSFNQMARQFIPSGLYGYYEDAKLVDQQGFVLDKEGQRKYLEPRTEREREVRKHISIRPLRERVEDSELYAEKKAFAKMNEKQRDAATRIKAAINFNDQEGLDAAILRYREYGGDPKNLETIINRALKERNLSARQRAQGTPSNSLGSIRRYQHFQEE